MTPSERYVAYLRRLGLSHKSVAETIGITERTSRLWANGAAPCDAAMLALSIMTKYPHTLTPEVVKAARLRMARASGGLGGVE